MATKASGALNCGEGSVWKEGGVGGCCGAHAHADAAESASSAAVSRDKTHAPESFCAGDLPTSRSPRRRPDRSARLFPEAALLLPSLRELSRDLTYRPGELSAGLKNPIRALRYVQRFEAITGLVVDRKLRRESGFGLRRACLRCRKRGSAFLFRRGYFRAKNAPRHS